MADLKVRWHVSRPGAVRLVHVPKWPAQPTEPPPSARRTGTADMRWAAPRWRRGVVMRADVDVAPSSPEPPPPTHPPILSRIRTRDVNLLASDGIGRPLSANPNHSR